MKQQHIIYLIIGIVIILSGALIFSLSSKLEVKAALFPKGISLLLVLFGLALLIHQIPFKAKQKLTDDQLSAEGSKANGKSGNEWRIFIFLLLVPLLSIGFIAVIPYIGFEASTFCFMFAITLSMSYSTALKRIYLSFLTPVILYLIFRFVLAIELPSTVELLLIR